MVNLFILCLTKCNYKNFNINLFDRQAMNREVITACPVTIAITIGIISISEELQRQKYP